jgi:hypothetical protein
MLCLLLHSNLLEAYSLCVSNSKLHASQATAAQHSKKACLLAMQTLHANQVLGSTTNSVKL